MISALPFLETYRARETFPILAICALPFAYSGFSNPAYFAADAVITFLALSFAFSLNDLFDGTLSREDNPIARLASSKGKAFAIVISSIPAVAASLIALAFPVPAGARTALFAFMLVFFLYSAEFPRLRNVPGADFASNVFAYSLLLLKSHFMHFSGGEGLLGLAASATYLISFSALSEAIHELAHLSSDSRSGRRTLFSFLGRKGAILLGAFLAALPLVAIALSGPAHAFASLFFSLLRLKRLVDCEDSREGYSRLRKNFLGREELAVHLALFAFGA